MSEQTSPNRLPKLEYILIAIIIVLAFASRFIDLGARVMSHDEVNHVVPSYDFSQGRGYRYDPVTHGPLQFHMIALSYVLFGDNDFTSRIPAAALSVFTVIFTLIYFRRYLGKWGALAAGLALLISPYMLFYGRYARNEAYIVVWALLTIYSILRYLEKGDRSSLILFTLANALHFTDKATAYIFAAIELMFLTGYLVYRITRVRWSDGNRFNQFLIGLMAALVALGGAAGLYLSQPHPIAAPMLVITILLALGGAAALVFSVVALVRGYGIPGLRGERAFTLVFLLGTLILPLGAALPIKMAGFNPLEYQQNIAIIRDAVAIVLLGILGVVIGWWLKREEWFLYAAIFYVPYFLLYSTFFTNGVGLAAGFMGALGYWMEQQGVERGSQPLFYYALLQIPIYEYLPAIGTLVAFFVGIFRNLMSALPGQPFVSAKVESVQVEPASDENGELPVPAVEPEQPVPTLALLLFWSLMVLLAFTYAGERMPWLTIHITLPLCLTFGWLAGWLVETADWSAWKLSQYARAATLVFFGILAVLTARAAYFAAYINYDYPTEYLVYAHAARDPKTLLTQIQEISERTTGDPYRIVVAYDNNVRYPYWWYLRRFPNRIDFDKTPTSDIRRAAVIVVSTENLNKVLPIVREDYYKIELMRLWWPNQDYWDLKWDNIDAERRLELGQDAPPMSFLDYTQYAWRHISPFFTDPLVRKAVIDIWLNRDYAEYARLKNSQSFTLTTWSPAEKMTAYIRKDVAAQVWSYGNTPIVPESHEDPYENLVAQIAPDMVIGSEGIEPGQFASPRSVAIAPDGSFYVADSRNHRIQRFAADGSLLKTWGTFGDAAQGAPGGQFNEPWGVAVGPDGSVYVSDTWNHRIQKFTADGQFVTMWGKAGLADTPESFYGPRGIVTDANGHIYVTDTGNSRVVVFDANGAFITQFGRNGVQPNEFNEPVGIAIDADGNVYVNDTWNQRVQVFAPEAGGQAFGYQREFGVEAWFGNSIENKPFITVDGRNHVFISDPETCRVLEFDPEGKIVRVWGQCSAGSDGFGLPSGLAIDSTGIWVSDAGNNTLLHFKPE